jgi:mono/diheme cytochrome c family protein
VLVIALAGGPGGVRGVLHRESRVARTVRGFVFALVAAGGLAVPIAVALANGQDKARVGPAGITLTKDETIGRELFARTCATCHTLAAATAVGHVGPDLDVLLPNQALVLYAIQHGFARGSGQMPAGIYVGPQAKDVAQFVAAVAGRN